MFFKPGKLTPKTDLGQSGWFGGLNWMSCSTGTQQYEVQTLDLEVQK